MPAIYMTMIFAFTALPAFVPVQYNVAGTTVRAHEPFLLVAVLYAMVKFKASRRLNLITLAFASVVAIGFVVAIAEQNEGAKLLYDARPLAEGAAMVFVAVRVLGTEVAQAAMRVTKWLLWVSAAVVLAGGVLGIQVGGRTEEASLADPYGTSGAATRLLTNATFPALAVLCAVAALVIARRATLGGTWVYSVPALLVTILSFSRNSILAVAVAILFAVIATRTASAALRAFGVVLVSVAAFACLVILNPVLATLPGGDFVNTQVTSYSTRVIGGLSSTVQATDSSVLFRASEDAWLLRGIASSPLVGHGFGFAYKPSAGTSSFTLDYAPYYAHNFYLWLGVKTGLAGALMFVMSIAGSLVRALKESSMTAFSVSAALVGLLAASYVAPTPIGSTSSILFGALVGALAYATERGLKDEGQQQIAAEPLEAIGGRR
jgi:O-antigen ligase